MIVFLKGADKYILKNNITELCYSFTLEICLVKSGCVQPLLLNYVAFWNIQLRKLREQGTSTEQNNERTFLNGGTFDVFFWLTWLEEQGRRMSWGLQTTDNNRLHLHFVACVPPSSSTVKGIEIAVCLLWVGSNLSKKIFMFQNHAANSSSQWYTGLLMWIEFAEGKWDLVAVWTRNEVAPQICNGQPLFVPRIG